MVLAVGGGGASASALFKRRECYVCSRDGGSGVGCSSIWLPPDGDERSRRKRRSGMHRTTAEGRREAVKAAAAFWRQEPVLEMESISDTEQLDQILTSSQQEEAIVIEWMAAWCRKCIYLKPKLEKLAAEFHPKVKFYSIDVNKVSQSLIKRGNISKMPTIQLWKDGEMKEEIIGGHKAWLVVEEVREMIKNNI